MSVRVTFTYEPDEPDDSDKMGISSSEFEQMTDSLMMNYGADEIDFERVVATEEPSRGGGPKR
jgi:hypothetical protein